MVSEGASDSSQDLAYTSIDKNQKNNVLLFDVINGEIQVGPVDIFCSKK